LGEFEAWLDPHHDLLIQHHKIEALGLGVKSVPSLVLREPLYRGKNDGDEASSSASSPILGLKLGPRGKKRDQVLIVVALLQEIVSYRAL